MELIKLGLIIFLYNLVLISLIAVTSPFWVLAVFMKRKWRQIFFKRAWLDVPKDLGETAGCIWIHGLSVGEALSAKPLVEKLLEKGTGRMVFSVSTLTGWQTALKMFEGTDIPVIFFPFDFPYSVRKAIKIINPSSIIIVENDIWPNFVRTAKREGIPLVWANARVSDRSYGRYRSVVKFAGPFFDLFDLVLAQTGNDVKRLSGIGISPEKIIRSGNLKFDRSYGENIPENLTKEILLGVENETRVFVAGSTHHGEEEILAEVFESISKLKRGERVLFVVAPRDPMRASEVAGIFGLKGVKTAFLSGIENDKKCKEKPDVVVVDTLGRLLELYSVCDLAFIGGSLVPLGGHNPLEPAFFGKPVLFGPHMNDFREIASNLLKSGGGFEVSSSGDIKKMLLDFLSDAKFLAETGMRAFEASRNERGVAEICVNAFLPIIGKDG